MRCGSLFAVRDGKLRQKVLASAEVKIEKVKCEDGGIDETLRSLIKPFDMASAPLMRASVIETPSKNVLFIDMHHSISDRRTAEVFLADLTAIYGGMPLTHKHFEYKDYAVWQAGFPCFRERSSAAGVLAERAVGRASAAQYAHGQAKACRTEIQGQAADI